MQPIICTEPMELVHIDYVGMEVTIATDKKPVVKNVLVVVDHFMRYVQAFVTKNHMARTTARVLYNNYFTIFGFPQHLMSDQGTEFCGKVIAAMCSLLGIEKIRMTPYHPQTNRSAERVHQTLQCMIGKLDPEKRKKMARTHWIDNYCLQFNKVTGDWVFPVLPDVREEAPVTH